MSDIREIDYGCPVSIPIIVLIITDKNGIISNHTGMKFPLTQIGDGSLAPITQSNPMDNGLGDIKEIQGGFMELKGTYSLALPIFLLVKTNRAQEI